ncbi:MAG: hypothetical protein QW303_04545 [Nitrososphaerota archaeon]
MRVIILTTKLINGDWELYNNGNSALYIDLSEECKDGSQVKYKRIIHNSDKNLFLINGNSLASGKIDLTKLKEKPNTNADINENCKIVTCFLELINKFITKENLNNAEIIFAIHWGGAGKTEYFEWTENLRNWIKEVCQKEYNFKISFWSTVLVPDSKVNEAITSNNKGTGYFDNFFDALVNRSETPGVLVSLYKHQIVSTLEFIYIDIEGLIDRNFEQNYWDRIVNYWKEKNIVFEDILKDVRNLIYFDDIDGTTNYKNLQYVLENNIANFNSLKSWSKIQNILPKQKNSHELEKVIYQLELVKKDKKADFINLIKKEGNLFGKWMNKLTDALDELINEVLKSF